MMHGRKNIKKYIRNELILYSKTVSMFGVKFCHKQYEFGGM